MTDGADALRGRGKQVLLLNLPKGDGSGVVFLYAEVDAETVARWEEYGRRGDDTAMIREAPRILRMRLSPEEVRRRYSAREIENFSAFTIAGLFAEDIPP